MVDLDNAVDRTFDVVDKAMENKFTQRQSIDMTSPFKLPQLIRPISFIWTMANETILTWSTIALAFFAENADPNATNALMAALAANTTVLATIVGFYFDSRKKEKITAKKAEAAIELERIKTKFELREEKREAKHERKMEKKEQ